jgi:hypothetical protein
VTQIVPFAPSNYSAPRFQVTLDSRPYFVAVTWNFAALRYYINVYDLNNGTLICAIPLTGTPPGMALAALRFDQNLGAVIATLAQPSYRPAGQIVEYTITGCLPAAFNGVYRCLTIDDARFSYPLAADPGQAVVLGAVTRCLNMLDPWFNSTLIFRNMQFEANP